MTLNQLQGTDGLGKTSDWQNVALLGEIAHLPF
jgi:hypothetical protein